ncbi:MAG: hypothetical protein HS104_33380 [Polyangiaceae bacterium]|nr:hypothetical protein [Polyangiaceae bacterium]
MELSSFLTARVRLLAVALGLGLGVHCSSARPPPRSLEGLASMLGQASRSVVAPTDIAWEPSPGLLAETFLGRRLVFLGAEKAGAPRDVYRARVRVTLDGKPISVTQIRNLTDTPLGDDTGLEVRGTRAVYATVAYGSIQGITVLDLGGMRREDKPESRFHRILQAITAFQERGSFADMGRTDIVLEMPAREARLLLDGAGLRVELGDAARTLVYDAALRELKSADGGQPYAAHADVHRQMEKPLILWGVDTVRAEVGPAPIAWLEDKVFGARDKFKRTTFQMFASSGASNTLKDEAQTEKVRATVLDASKLKEGESWPPPAIPSIWKENKPGEGEWQPVALPFLKPMPGTDEKHGKAPAYFYKTFFRPDAARPYSEVMLIAMDMRQLELGMQAGFEDPKPLTGPPGDGRLPRDKAVLDRIVGTFNGAFKTTHGRYGMKVDDRVLIPPVAGGATVMVTKDGSVGLGSWPKSEEIPDEIRSFRQNLDPLVEDGVANPTGRYIWGWQLSGTSVMTQRTALCVTAAGHLYYAFAPEIDGPTLGKALAQAGCSYGVHLDMNPGHCGFVYTDIVDYRAKEFNLKKAHDAMNLDPGKFVRWSAKDFFYVMVRDPVPTDPSGVRWSPDGGLQPPPQWLPGVFKGKLKVGNLEVELASFEPGRVGYRVRAGSKEPRQSNMAGHVELTGEDSQRVVAAIGLGHTTDAMRLGIAFAGTQALDPKAAYATLVVSPGKPLAILAPGEVAKLDKDDESVQLPLLAENGKLTDAALAHGPLRLRGALCALPSGRVLVATARHDSSDSLAAALLKIGCTRVVEIDRGSQHPAFVHRAGSETPPLASYETSVLYAVGRPMLPHAFRWKAEGSEKSTKPTLWDVSPDVGKKKKAAPKPAPEEGATP